jgi:hypothetical protein
LESLVEDLRADAQYAHLANSLEKIRDSVQAHWTNVALPDFTDHGPNHSRRVAEYAEKLATLRDLPPSLKLDLRERYLLSAAAWLHDVGMQDERANIFDPGDKAIADPQTVRRTHPQRSEHLVLQRQLDLGLPTNEIAAPEAIARLVLAHGTETYQATVASITEPEASFMNKPVKLKLLAALLLMADELDLHYERVPPANPMRPLNHESSAHWLKHECVRSVDLFEEEGGIQIVVNLMSPSSMQEDDVARVKEWIATKLQRQMVLTESEILSRTGFNRHYHFNRQIRLPNKPARRDSEHATPQAAAIIDRENAYARLISHRSTLSGIVEYIKNGEPVLLVDSEDLTGGVDMKHAIDCHFRSEGWNVLSSNTLDPFGLTSVAEQIAIWSRWLAVPFDAPSSAREGVRRLVNFVRSQPEERYLFSLNAGLNRELERDALGELLHELTDIDNAGIFVLGVEDFADITNESWVKVQFGDLTEQDCTEYLARYLANDAKIVARNIPRTYANIKSFAIDHALGR